MRQLDQEAIDYFERKQVTPVLESILAGLTVNKPEDPITYMEECLAKIKKEREAGKNGIEWDTFVRSSKASSQHGAGPGLGHPPKRPNAGSHHIEPIQNKGSVVTPLLPQVQAKSIFSKPAGTQQTTSGKAGLSVQDGELPQAHRKLPAISKSTARSPVKSKDDDGAEKRQLEPKPKSTPDINHGGVAASHAPNAEDGPQGNKYEFPSDKVVFVLGGPGCGKGTNCARLEKEFGLTHLSAGDLLRAEVATGSELGKEVQAMMKEGKIVPMEVTLVLLRKAMMAAKQTTGYLIDGFPRQMDQAIEFEKQVTPCKFVLFFDCPQALMEQRLLKRGETSGRTDDNAETILKRFKTFQETSMPVIEYFETSGRVRKVSSEGTMDEVYRNAASYFEEFRGTASTDTVQQVSTTPASQLVSEEVPAKMASKNIVFVLGGPGSGKGTNCARLAVEFGLKHLSTGDLLRAEVASGSERGQQLNAIMKEGAMVSLDTTMSLLKQAMLNTGPTNGYLIDGFPRQIEQAMEFEKQIGPPTTVLYFECSEALMLERLLKRGETSGRADDNAETIKKRFATFMQESFPVVEHYKKLGKSITISSAALLEDVYKAARLPFTQASGDNSSAVPLPSAARVRADSSNVVFVLGGPGSGKGTQCDRIVKTLGFAHLSTGDLLRAEVAKGTEIGQMLEALMKEGKMVSLDTTLTLLTTAINSRMAENPSPRGFLIDGFPRTLEQAEAFEKSVARGRFALFFTCPSEALVKRLLKRGETSGRADDNLESIKKRIDTFNEITMPVAEYFKLDGRLKEINSEGAVDIITEATLKAFSDEGIQPAE